MTIDLRSAAPPRAGHAHRAPSGARAAHRVAAPGDQRRRLALVMGVQLACLALIVALSRVAFVHQSLRLDEAQSLSQVSHDYRAMLAVVAQDVHVPGYHVLLRTWRLLFGLGIETARTLSLIFFMASVPVLYLVARRVLTTGWALLVVALFSCSPFMQWYGDEARMYTMLVFVTLVSQLFFLRVLEDGRSASWAGYAASGVIGAYTHYFFLFVLVCQGVFFLLQRPRPRLGGLVRLAGTAALVAVALLPWLLYFRASGSGSGTRPHLPSPSSVDLTNVYAQFLFGFQSDAVNSVLVAAWPLLVLAGLASVRVGVRVRRETAYLLVAAFGPVLLAFLLSHLVTPFFLSRYMIAALPAVLVVLVRFISVLTRRAAVGLGALALVVAAASTGVEATSSSIPVKEDYRRAAEVLDARVTPSDVVVISSPFTVYPVEYYYRGTAAVTTLPAWDPTKTGGIPPFNPAQLPQQVDALVTGHQRIYLLLSYDQGYEDDIYQYFQHNFERVASYDLSPGMRLIGYRVGYSQHLPVGSIQLSAPPAASSPAPDRRPAAPRTSSPAPAPGTSGG